MALWLCYGHEHGYSYTTMIHEVDGGSEIHLAHEAFFRHRTTICLSYFCFFILRVVWFGWFGKDYTLLYSTVYTHCWYERR